MEKTYLSDELKAEYRSAKADWDPEWGEFPYKPLSTKKSELARELCKMREVHISHNPQWREVKRAELQEMTRLSVKEAQSTVANRLENMTSHHFVHLCVVTVRKIPKPGRLILRSTYLI